MIDLTATEPSAPSAIHATAVAVGESGILIRGASGAGKSRLALAVIDEAHRRGLFARLIGDDRVTLTFSGGRLLAHAHPSIAGLIEERGAGILAVAHEASAVVRAVVDLADERSERSPRLPDAAEKSADIGGVPLPRLSLEPSRPASDAAVRVLAFLGNS
ncbi:MAG TPA: HPr kinase/phosphatase C-terminal domain-containing protein [Beijerinckiaceae bacterium]|jgi:serine kinase of HPr protein (carbohydrate metabolism regulator)|nr:HPr kinase/phosphatase C-terminal domain-containing protein [Beijerinckiaceae bacterium]